MKNFRLLYTQKTLPQLIKYCLDIDCSSNDGGIAPKNLCQSCLDKLQHTFEFKSKSQESEKYLKQIISHSIAQQPEPVAEIPDEDISMIPYSTSYDDPDNLLQPMDDYEDLIHGVNGSGFNTKAAKDDLPRKGLRHGEFQCQICSKSFRYIKAYKNHIKMHKQQKSSNVSYYKRKKMLEAAGIYKSPPKAKVSAKPPRFKMEHQAEYDSLSPYNSPAPYEPETPQRDMSPDFGALMLSTSQIIGDELGVVESEAPKTTRSGRPLKRPNQNEELSKANGAQKRNRPSVPLKKTPVLTPTRTVTKKVEEVVKKPGPSSSKTRSKPAPSQKESEDTEESFTIEGFSEVDISKMLKKSKKRDRMIELGKFKSKLKYFNEF